LLEELGLSPAAEAVYRAMVSEPRIRIVELCEQLELTEQEVRTGLDELVRFTLLRESRDDPGQLRTVSPEIGLRTLLKRQEEELDHRQRELARTRRQVIDAVAEYATLQPDAVVAGTRRLVGLDAIQAQLEILTRDLNSECLSIMPGGAQSHASLAASQPLDQDALARGVRVLTLYQNSVRNSPETLAYARWLTDLGGQVRTAPILPPRLLVFDRKIAVVPIDPANSKLGALCTTEPGFVASLAAVFDQAWSTAVPLGAAAPTDFDTGLTPVDRELLKLLATGLTDEAAGRRLGLSARTVRRQMAALMERLDAASRFEAGLKAAQRGWLLPAAPAAGAQARSRRRWAAVSGEMSLAKAPMPDSEPARYLSLPDARLIVNSSRCRAKSSRPARACTGA
jgi:DNA-binding CsgD family transcriptional regulator/predicted DNA-binding transcriptional regulator